MSEVSYPFVDWILASAGIGGLIWGIYTYREGQIAKRVEILFPLIREFDTSEEMILAKEILDAKRIQGKKIDNSSNDPREYDIRKLDRVLRYDESRVFTGAEEKIRESFDSLLDFFCKMDYLLEIGILKGHEISYFKYYIDRAVKIDALIKYAVAYNFPFHGYLDKKLNLKNLDNF